MSEDFRPALIVVDMQQDFCHPEKGALPCSGGALHLVEPINELLNLPGWAVKIATINSIHDDWAASKDNHPEDKTHHDLPNINNPSKTHKHRLWPKMCKEGTDGHKLAEGLEEDKIDLVVEKNKHPGIVMYSGFGDTHGNKKHDLPEGAVSHHIDDELLAKDVTHVFLCGTAGDHCVAHTSWDAVHFGFKTYLLEDLVANIDEDGKEYAVCKKKGEKMGVQYVKSNGEEMQKVRDLTKE